MEVLSGALLQKPACHQGGLYLGLALVRCTAPRGGVGWDGMGWNGAGAARGWSAGGALPLAAACSHAGITPRDGHALAGRG